MAHSRVFLKYLEMSSSERCDTKTNSRNSGTLTVIATPTVGISVVGISVVGVAGCNRYASSVLFVFRW